MWVLLAFYLTFRGEYAQANMVQKFYSTRVQCEKAASIMHELGAAATCALAPGRNS